jgi:tetratricopeptide (TPR) repeat protein
MKIHVAIAAMFLVSSAAWAAGGGGGPNIREEPADPVIEAVQGAVAKADWVRARDLARAGVEKNPANADYQNLLAYSLRMGPNPPMDLVFRHYNEALRLDPKHRGAHEYLGEAYLMAGNLEKAREHLRVLDDLCFLPCREYSMLKQAVADYESKRGRPASK